MRFPLSRRRRHRWLAAAALGRVLAIVVVVSVAYRADPARGEERAGVSIAQSDPAPADEGVQEGPAAAEETPAAAEPKGTPPDSELAPPGVEVIQVRGRGAAAIEADVPASITQFDASTIEALGAQDISELSRVTPNVNIVQPGSTQAIFFVRGIGLSDFSSNAAGAVTVFQDDVSLNAPAIQTGQLFDVEGIDIVRGPQGTGPFRNASAGAIRVRSRRPTGNYQAQLRSTIGRYDTKGDKGARNALIQDYEGALEMPIVADLVSSRFAFRLRDAEPYRLNGCGNGIPFDQRLPFGGTPDSRVHVCNPEIGLDNALIGRPSSQETAQSFPRSNGFFSIVPPGLPREVGDEHNWAARGTLRINPRDTDLDFFLNGHGSRLDQDSTLGQAIGTEPLPGQSSLIRFGGTSRDGYMDLDARQEFFELCGRVGRVVCANQYIGHQFSKRLASGRPLDEKPYRGDYNRVGQTTRDAWGAFASGEATVLGDIKLFALTSYDRYERFQDSDTDFTPNVLFELVQSDDAWQMYHQLGLEGELEAEPIQWNLGAYYLEESLDTDADLLLTGEAHSHRIYTQDLESFGIWGGFGWDFADDFTLEGGVRYNWEHKDFDFRIEQNVLAAGEASSRKQETWQTPTGQLTLTYHIDADKAAFAKYTRGFKAGHFNSLASNNLNDPPADEEYNDAWETGLRGSWLNRRISLASSFFYYRYTNYQVFVFIDSAGGFEPPVLTILNAKRAENYGIEVEGALQPLEGWAPRFLSGLRLSANFSWLHGEYIDFQTTRRFATTLGLAVLPIDYSGKSLQNSPEYKTSGTAEWTFNLGRFGYLIPRYDINWSADTFFDPNEGRGSIDPTGGPALVKYGVGQKQFFLHNVRLSYRTPTGNVELAGWIRNVADEVYKNYAFDASRFTSVVINFPGEPRSYGVDVIVTF